MSWMSTAINNNLAAYQCPLTQESIQMLHKSSHVIITSTSNQYLKNQPINTNQTVFQYTYRQLWLLHSNTFSHNNKSIDLKVLQYIWTGITPQKWITSTFSHKSSLTSNAAFTCHFISERGKKEMKTQNLRCSKNRSLGSCEGLRLR